MICGIIILFNLRAQHYEIYRASCNAESHSELTKCQESYVSGIILSLSNNQNIFEIIIIISMMIMIMIMIVKIVIKSENMFII